MYRFAPIMQLTALMVLTLGCDDDPLPLADTAVDTEPDTAFDTELDTAAEPELDTTPDRVEDTVTYPGHSVVVELTFATTERGRGVYIWITDDTGAYVDTVHQYFGRTDSPGVTYDILGVRYPNDVCNDWRLSSGEGPTGPLVVDGVTGASPLGPYSTGTWTSPAWDCLDSTGSPIAAGTYTVNVEVTFDGPGHPVLPVSRFTGTLEIGAAGCSTPLGPADTKVTVATAIYTPS